MKIYRFVAGERTYLGLEIQGALYAMESLYERAGESTPEVVGKADLRSICAAPDAIVVFLQDFINSLGHKEIQNSCEHFAVNDVRILSPIPGPEKFICIGLNYLDHCEEQNKQAPTSPVIFSKYSNAICGHEDVVMKPLTTSKMDYEGELAVIIGTGGRRIPREKALEYVFGYTIVNDISARDLQKQDGQFLRAKTQDNFAPMGPCVVTAGDIPDPNNLKIQTRLNGTTMQDSNTSRMIFDVQSLIAFISEGITLSPGDVISTGTPSGVGVHRTPPVFLKGGDVVEVEIEGIGTLLSRFSEES